MSAVLHAEKPKQALTNSQEDDFRNLEISENYLKGQSLSLPELYGISVDRECFPPNTVTSAAIDAFHASSEVRKDVIDKIIAFKSLNENWDGYGAYPLEVKSASSAIQFILFLNDRIIEKINDVYPTPNGTVSLVWENEVNEKVALEIGNNTLSYYVKLNSQKPIFFNAIEINAKEANKISNFIKAL
jgi:hypothetical protein